MDLLPTDEQADLVVVVRDFLARELPPAAAPAIRAGDRFQELWSSIAELGWFGLSVPEAAGGLGFGLVEEALLFIELGRGVAPGPFLSTSLACQLALSGGSAELLAELIAGESRAGLAIPLADRDDGDDEAPYLVVDGHDHRCRHLIVQRPGRLELVTAPPLDALTAVPSIDEGTTLAEARRDTFPDCSSHGRTGTNGGIMNFLNNLMGAVAPITTGYIVGATHSFTGAFMTAGSS